jgi:hypothetical protein
MTKSTFFKLLFAVMVVIGFTCAPGPAFAQHGGGGGFHGGGGGGGFHGGGGGGHFRGGGSRSNAKLDTNRFGGDTDTSFAGGRSFLACRLDSMTASVASMGSGAIRLADSVGTSTVAWDSGADLDALDADSASTALALDPSSPRMRPKLGSNKMLRRVISFGDENVIEWSSTNECCSGTVCRPGMTMAVFTRRALRPISRGDSRPDSLQ